MTIGLSQVPSASAGEAGVSTVQSAINPWTTNFDSGDGLPSGDIVIDDAVGGAWFALNGDAKREANAEYQALATQFASMVRTTDDVYLRFHPEQSLSRASN